MQLTINLLSLILVVVALFLGLLILVQLPKKEAGITAAFGAESTAAIFGAGSGTALTQLTRWAATAFLLLCLIITVLTAQMVKSRPNLVKELVTQAPASAAPAALPGISTPVPLAPVSATSTVPATLPAP
jgi:preprotein translocase subunit SecG